MPTQKTLEIAGLVFGLLGTFYLSYDLLDKPGGLLRYLLEKLLSSILFTLLFAIILVVLDLTGINRDEGDYVINVLGFGLSFLAISALINIKRKPGSFQIRNTILGGLLGFAIIDLLSISYFINVPEAYYIIRFNIFALLLGLLYAFSIQMSIRVYNYVNKLPPRGLGAIGAFMTVIAFAVQLGLAIAR